MPRAPLHIALALPVLAACGGTLRLYDGPPRALADVALLRGSVVYEEDPVFDVQVTTQADVVVVNGVQTSGFDLVELEPGIVTILIEASGKVDGALDWRLADELSFEAVADGDYAARAVPGRHARPVALTVWDTRFGRRVATNEPSSLDQLVHAVIDLGPEWRLVDWYAGGPDTNVTYFPAGQSAGAWTRAVEAQYYQSRNRAMRTGELENRLVASVKARCKDLEVEIVDRGATAVACIWSGENRTTEHREWGVALVRRGANGIHVLAHVTKLKVLSSEEIAAWRVRFRAARLIEGETSDGT